MKQKLILFLLVAASCAAQVKFGVPVLSVNDTLQVIPSGSGTGTVSDSHGQIIGCGISSLTQCTGTYLNGSTVTLQNFPTSGSTFVWAAGTGSLAICNGGTGTCGPIVITANSTITAIFTAAGGTGLAASPMFGIDPNSLSIGCPPAGGHFASGVSHGLERFWDLSGVEWAFVQGNVADTYSWTQVDDMLCAMANNTVKEAHWTLARTPYVATSNQSGTTCHEYVSTWMTDGPGGTPLYNEAPGQCYPPKDLNTNGTGANQYWRDWIGASVSHVNQPGYIAGTGAFAGKPHAHMAFYDLWNEPEIGNKYWTGSYDQLQSMMESLYCIVKGGTHTVNGNVSSGLFVAGETVTQAVTGASATLMGAPQTTTRAHVLMNFNGAASGSPDGTHDWVGGTSGAHYTPTATPAALTVTATGETCVQVRTATTHGAGSSVVDTTKFPNFPALPLDTTAILMGPSYHGKGVTLGQYQCFMYCGQGGAAINDCGTPATSCTHGGSHKLAEDRNFHLKPGAEYPVAAEVALNDYLNGGAEGAGTTSDGINNVTSAADQAKPIYNSEFSYSECGWPSSSCLDASSPFGDHTMEAAYFGEMYAYAPSLNIDALNFYNWSFTKGQMGSGQAQAGFNQIFNWEVGASLTGCPNVGGVYTCTLTSAGGTSQAIVWDDTQTCTTTSDTVPYGYTCTTSKQTVGSSFTTATDLLGQTATIGACSGCTAHQLLIKVLPQLLQ